MFITAMACLEAVQHIMGIVNHSRISINIPAIIKADLTIMLILTVAHIHLITISGGDGIIHIANMSIMIDKCWQ